MVQLAVASRQLKRALAVGSIPPEMSHAWDMMEAQGLEVKFYHRAKGHGEQEVHDEKLQFQMMIDTVDNMEHPETAVML